MFTKNNLIPFIATLLICGLSHGAGTFETALIPVVITNPEPVYYPNQNSDPNTGLKPGYTWPSDLNPNVPLHDMWLTSEHALVPTGSGRWLLVAMEQNWNLLQYQSFPYMEAFNFVEWDNTGFPSTPTLPSGEEGYWRGGIDGDRFSHVWAPSVFEESGTYYLYYPARIPDNPNGKVYPFLATSPTGDGDPAAWTHYDPDPMTSEAEPLFEVGTTRGGRDFYVVKVGSEYRMYYCVDVFDNDLGVLKTETWMRTSSNLTDWDDATEVSVFDFINIGETLPARYATEYENPNVIQLDNGDFYLFVSRHSLLPVDYPDPGWTMIPSATEVFWSADGLYFDPAHQLPDLQHLDGSGINSSEVLQDGNRWFASDATGSGNPDHYVFTGCQTDCIGDELLQMFIDQQAGIDQHQMRLVEFIWTVNASSSAGWDEYE